MSKKLQTHPLLKEHTHEFRKEIIEAVPGVHVAIGYGLANSILIEGTDAVIIVDTLESKEAAEGLKVDFDKIRGDRPIAAVIFTHNHADHVLGAGVFADENTPVIAHETTQYYLERFIGIIRPSIGRRSMRQFGTFLPEDWFENAGIGPELINNAKTTPSLRWPTRTISDRWVGEIAGVELEMIHTPGETNDAMSIWLADRKTMISADNLYRTFPNLYAIRGTPHRDVMQWVRSLDKVKAYRPEVMIPCHTRPLYGADQIEQTITDYRDAIQFVHDQTIRWMNKGLTPDEIVEKVKLPRHLAESPFLREHYGTIAWSVRSIFDGYLGFFSGEARDLHPLPPAEKAAEMAKLAGGADKLLEAAQTALDEPNHQWALELADHLLVLDGNNQSAQTVKKRALMALGEAHISANGRNYYLTQALEIGRSGHSETLNLPRVPRDQAATLPLSVIFDSMPTALDPNKCIDLVQSCSFDFGNLTDGDTGQAYSVLVRRGVAEIRPELIENADIQVMVDPVTWKEIVMGYTNAVRAIMGGKLKISGDPLAFSAFMGLFRQGLNLVQWRALQAFCDHQGNAEKAKTVADQILNLPEPIQSGAIALLQQLEGFGFVETDASGRDRMLTMVGGMNPQAPMVIEALKQAVTNV